MLNSIVFHPPAPTYDINTPHLTMVPRERNPLYHVPAKYINLGYKYTILMCHGNAEDIGTAPIKDLATQWHANICVFDYAGYGMHTKRDPSEEDCYRDGQTVYGWLLKQGILPNTLIIYGRSLGTGLACRLARYKSCLRLILVSPFMSVMLTRLPFSLWGDMFPNYKFR